MTKMKTNPFGKRIFVLKEALDKAAESVLGTGYIYSILKDEKFYESGSKRLFTYELRQETDMPIPLNTEL